jgi:hypothetical protein
MPTFHSHHCDNLRQHLYLFLRVEREFVQNPIPSVDPGPKHFRVRPVMLLSLKTYNGVRPNNKVYSTI